MERFEDCPTPNPARPLHDYYVTGEYRTYNNQHGIGALNDFRLEVRADDIESAAKIAEDKIMSDGRRHADSVRDMEIFLLEDCPTCGLLPRRSPDGVV